MWLKKAKTVYCASIKVIALVLGTCIFLSCQSINASQDIPQKSKQEDNALDKSPEEIYDTYIAFFEEVYQVVMEHYYFPVEREDFDQFIERFNKKIYAKIQNKEQESKLVKWRSAAFMIDFLKDSEDTFSAFFPPKPAEKYEKEVLGKKVNLGIEGELVKEGYIVLHIEPRSNAYQEGLRKGDIIQEIDGVKVAALTKEEIEELLTPLVDIMVRIFYIERKTKAKKKIEILSQEYFKQSVFMIPVDIPGVFCLEIRTFNRKTSDDMFRFLSIIEKQGDSKLILDLRNNPGGPPLAAREISAFFLPANEEFAYFQKKGQPKALLDVPEIPKEYHYKGPIVILVNEKSGSASELFSGVLQERGRAVLMGVNTAGKVLLKSMFHFDDESMVLLVTARGHFPNGDVFSFNGLTPDQYLEGENIDLINFAAGYLQTSGKKD